MKNRMIVALDAGTDRQRDAITIYLRDRGWDLWHWVADVWLLADVPETVSPRDLWLQLESILEPEPVRGFVMTTGQESKYWGSNQSDSWTWLHRLWGTPDFSAEDRRQASYQNQGR